MTKARKSPGVLTRIKSACVEAWESSKLGRIFNLENAAPWNKFFGGTNHSGQNVTERTVLQLSAANACVRLISETISTLPFRLLRERADGFKEPAKQHNLYALLAISPNSRMTAAVFWQAYLASLLIRGNAYVEKTLSAGVITSLFPLLPDRVQYRKDLGVWQYNDPETGLVRDIPKSRMWHTPAFTLDGITGISPLVMGAQSFGSAQAVEKAAAETFKNGMKSPGILTVAGMQSVSKDQREQFKRQIMRESGSGEPLILEKDSTWQTLTFSPEDAELLASRAFSIEEVCRWFGVPPFLVGHSEKSTSWGTGIEQQQIGFVQMVLRRWIVRIEQSIDMNLLGPTERLNYSSKIAIEGLLRGDNASRSAYYAQMMNNGAMTRDEVRNLEDLPPMGGNAAVLMAQTAMAPIDTLGATEAPASEAKSSLLAWLGITTAKETT